MTTFLGIDPGLATVGFGVVTKNGSEIQFADSGIIQTPAGMPMPERLCMIKDDLVEILTLHKPDFVAIEELYFATNAKTAIHVAQARGVIVETVQRMGFAITEMTPLQLKLNITGDGSAPKWQIQEMVKRLLKLNRFPKPDDAADGLALAICAERIYQTHMSSRV